MITVLCRIPIFPGIYPMKKSKVYYYIKFSECGNSVTGYRIVTDANLVKLKKQWLSEIPGNVTPISEGFEFERPKRKPTPEEQATIDFVKAFSRHAIVQPSKKFLKETEPVKPKSILDKIAVRANKNRRVFRLWSKSGKNHKPGTANGKTH